MIGSTRADISTITAMRIAVIVPLPPRAQSRRSGHGPQGAVEGNETAVASTVKQPEGRRF